MSKYTPHDQFIRQNPSAPIPKQLYPDSARVPGYAHNSLDPAMETNHYAPQQPPQVTYNAGPVIMTELPWNNSRSSIGQQPMRQAYAPHLHDRNAPSSSQIQPHHSGGNNAHDHRYNYTHQQNYNQVQSGPGDSHWKSSSGQEVSNGPYSSPQLYGNHHGVRSTSNDLKHPISSPTVSAVPLKKSRTLEVEMNSNPAEKKLIKTRIVFENPTGSSHTAARPLHPSPNANSKASGSPSLTAKKLGHTGTPKSLKPSISRATPSAHANIAVVKNDALDRLLKAFKSKEEPEAMGPYNTVTSSSEPTSTGNTDGKLENRTILLQAQIVHYARKNQMLGPQHIARFFNVSELFVKDAIKNSQSVVVKARKADIEKNEHDYQASGINQKSSSSAVWKCISLQEQAVLKPKSQENLSKTAVGPKVVTVGKDSYTVSLRNRDVKMEATTHVTFNYPGNKGSKIYMGEDAIRLMEIAGKEESWNSDVNQDTTAEEEFSSSEEWVENGYVGEDEPAPAKKRGRPKLVNREATQAYVAPEPTKEEAKSAMELLGFSEEDEVNSVLHRLFPSSSSSSETKVPSTQRRLDLSYGKWKEVDSDRNFESDFKAHSYRATHWEGALRGRLQTTNCRKIASLNVSLCRTCRDVAEEKPLCLFLNVRRLNIQNGEVVTCGFEIAENLERARDLKAGHWIPDPVNSKVKWTPALAAYILRNLKPTFDALMEKESWLLSVLVYNRSNVVTQMPVYRELLELRELCDICATTVTNLHLFCALCGLIVCPDCVKDRNSLKLKGERRGRWRNDEKLDVYGWPFCGYSQLKGDRDSGELFSHYPQDLVLASIVPDRAPFILSTLRILSRKVEEVTNAVQSPDSSSGTEGKTDCFPVPDSDPVTMENTESNAIKNADMSPTKSAEGENSESQVPAPVISYLCDGNLLILENDATKEGSSSREDCLKAFQDCWKVGKAAIVAHCTDDPSYEPELWKPLSLYKQLEGTSHENVHGYIFDCKTHKPALDVGLEDFWEGFVDAKKRYVLPDGNVPYLKFKDYPGHTTFRQALPEHFVNFCKLLPLPEYSAPQEEGEFLSGPKSKLQRGCFNLATVLPSNYVVPDLGPKMYTAYGMLQESTKATTNLHLDVSDAVNLMMSVTIPENMDKEYIKTRLLEQVRAAGIEGKDYDRVEKNWEEAGAIWTIWTPEDTVAIRLWLTEMREAAENLSDVDVGLRSGFSKMDDPIHDQSLYLTSELQKKLYEDCNIRGCTFVQMLGDAVFIPAGGGHQVQNLLSCIKIAEDFVSPEGVSRCAIVTQEFRDLSREHLNREDKVQLGNIVIHSVRNAVEALQKAPSANQTRTDKLLDSADAKTDNGQSTETPSRS